MVLHSAASGGGIKRDSCNGWVAFRTFDSAHSGGPKNRGGAFCCGQIARVSGAKEVERFRDPYGFTPLHVIACHFVHNMIMRSNCKVDLGCVMPEHLQVVGILVRN